MVMMIMIIMIMIMIMIMIIMMIITNTRLSRKTGGWLPAAWWGQLDLELDGRTFKQIDGFVLIFVVQYQAE